MLLVCSAALVEYCALAQTVNESINAPQVAGLLERVGTIQWAWSNEITTICCKMEDDYRSRILGERSSVYKSSLKSWTLA